MHVLIKDFQVFAARALMFVVFGMPRTLHPIRGSTEDRQRDRLVPSVAIMTINQSLVTLERMQGGKMDGAWPPYLGRSLSLYKQVVGS